MGTTDKPELRILVSFEETDDYGSGKHLRATAYIVRMEDGKVRNPSDDTWRNTAAFAADLKMTASAELEDRGEFYGYSCEYRSPYAVDLERAALMVKTLRKVKTGLERLEAKYGHPATFGQYVARVGDILDASCYGWVAEKGLGWSWDECDMRWTDAAGLDFHISYRLRGFRKPATEGAAA